MGPERDFYEGRQRTKQTEHQPRKVAYFIVFNTLMIKLVSAARDVLLKFYFQTISPRYRCFGVVLAKNHEKSIREM